MLDEVVKYGHAVTTSLPYDRAAARTRELLRAEGFGVLCEIDVAKTLKEKRGIDFRPYLILGACNPDYAAQALAVEEHLGLLLPCNVTVSVRDGKTVVAAIDPGAMLGVTGRPELSSIAAEVDQRLRRVLEALAGE